jgi:hypothetical protein
MRRRKENGEELHVAKASTGMREGELRQPRLKGARKQQLSRVALEI